MIGQGRPTAKLRAGARRALGALVLCALSLGPITVGAAEIEVRLRFAWGSGAQSPQKWFGRIAVAGGALESLQPLGIEADEAAAVRLIDNEVVVSPLVNRAFDGCDVTVRGDDAAEVTIELRPASAAEPKTLRVPLGQLARQEYRERLDDLGSYLVAHRSPGDRLRVRIDREHLVFQPEEEFRLLLTPDILVEAAAAPVTIDARLRRAGSAEVLWQTSVAFDPAAAEPIPLELAAPAAEGAYRLEIAAGRRRERFADKLVPWELEGPLAVRDVEFVVIDPAQRLPTLTDEWEVVATIDPVDSKWWQRAPHWTQLDKLPGFSTPRPLGNVRPAPSAGSTLGMAELPATPAGDEPAWQAYLLPTGEPGAPHAVEIEFPAGVRQHLAMSIIEPDAAGRVLSFGRDWGVYCEQSTTPGAAPTLGRHRVVFWPRTRTPVLLLANRSHSSSAQFGKIRLLRRSVVHAAGDDPLQRSPRLVAAYISAPRLAECLGGAEQLDPVSGLSVDGWATFLEGGSRLAQHLKAAGYNAAIVSVAADGASLAPIAALGSSPRYDTGLLAATGADPMRKDVLEALLRIFDREGLRLIPAVQLATPLPGLEALRDGADPQSSGVQWVAADGRTWAAHFPADAAATPRYNLLAPQVQAGVGDAVDQLVARYGEHPALAGVALQMAGNGFSVLPGLAWGMDDATAQRFTAETNIALPSAGPERFQQRAALLLGPQLDAWKQWRRQQTTSLYANLAARVSQDRRDRQLVLCTEGLFESAEAAQRLRQAVSGRGSLDDALDELGVDLRQLAATPGVALLRPRRLGADDALQARALDLRINSAAEFDQAVAGRPSSGELAFHTSSKLRLPSFDAQSPFGASKTYLSMSAPSAPSGDAARRALVTALAMRDVELVAEGGELLPLVDDGAHAEALRVVGELPAIGADVRSERRQPVTLRVYREAEATTIALVNESPWPVSVDLPLRSDVATPWRQLGRRPPLVAAEPAVPEDRETEGTLTAGPQTWSLTLPPYGIVARQFGTRGLQTGAFTPKIPDEARAALAAQVAEIEGRMQSLDVERRYQELQNAGFETGSTGELVVGWQPRVGAAGSVDVDATAAHSGERALHLQSQDTVGVAAQSHLFSIPATGQLVVRAQVQVRDLAPDARLYAWIEYEAGGVMRQRYQAVDKEQALDEGWNAVEVAFDDLPLASAGQMRVQFHLAGAGEAWVDDVELLDLWFPKSQRVEMFKRLYAANTALDDGNLVDCQRLVDGYWARFLLEQVPPLSVAAATPEPAPITPTDDVESKGIRRRIRGMVPKILR